MGICDIKKGRPWSPLSHLNENTTTAISLQIAV